VNMGLGIYICISLWSLAGFRDWSATYGYENNPI